jgi:glutathione synthase/RimK-type ligase-like ATP-grasp enzyme
LHKKIVLKPLSGNHGKKIFFIEKKNRHQYQIVDGSYTQIATESKLLDFVYGLLSEKKYMIQPFIECKTKAGLTYDFRLHVQKDGTGKWDINLIYPRISGGNKLISNVSSGGYRGDLDPFLIEEFGEDYFNIKRLLEQFALSFPKHFDTLYNYEFDELGIDIGIDKNKKLWIYEVNWRPGAKHREFEVAKRLIPYAVFLTKK